MTYPSSSHPRSVLFFLQTIALLMAVLLTIVPAAFGQARILRGGVSTKEKLVTQFRPMLEKFGQQSTTKIDIVSGPEAVQMRNGGVNGKQWIATSGEYRFKLTIEDVTKATLENLIGRLEKLPRSYLSACVAVSDEEEDGIAIYANLGGAAAHGGKGYINLIPRANALVIAHEAGHTLEQVAKESDPEILDKWEEAIKVDKISVSNYGDTVRHEDLAEFAMIFAVCLDAGPEHLAELKKLSPERFALWSKILYPARSKAKHVVPQVDQATSSPKHQSVIPAPRIAEWWFARQAEKIGLMSKGNIDLLMVGDSITNNFENEKVGLKVWEEYFVPLKAINLGFGGDRTEHVLWRLDHLPVMKVAPKAAVVLIGTNNICWGSDTPKQAAEGVRAITRKLKDIYPEMKVLVLGVLPRRRNLDHPHRRQIVELNSYLPELLKDFKGVTFRDIGPAFLDEKGFLSEEMMPDTTHPSEKGHEVWAKAIMPELKKMLGTAFAIKTGGVILKNHHEVREKYRNNP